MSHDENHENLKVKIWDEIQTRVFKFKIWDTIQNIEFKRL